MSPDILAIIMAIPRRRSGGTYAIEEWAAQFREIRAGRFPGIYEEPMTTFKFNLGASVVLVTSLALAVQQKTEADYELELKADRHAENQRNDYLSKNGRADLRSDARPRVAQSYGSNIAITRLRAADDVIERGTVIGRSEYANAEPSYLVRYRAADGRQTEAWFTDDAIAHDPAAPANGEVARPSTWSDPLHNSDVGEEG